MPDSNICFGIKIDKDKLYENEYPWGDSIYDWDIEEWWKSLPENEGIPFPADVVHGGYTQDEDQIDVILCIKESLIRGCWEGPTKFDPQHFTKAACIDNENFTKLLKLIGCDEEPGWFLTVSSDRG